MTDYEGQARRELLSEDAAVFQKRVEARAAKLQEDDRQMAEGAANFPCDPATRQGRRAGEIRREMGKRRDQSREKTSRGGSLPYDELVVRQTALLAREASDRSAADDAEIDQLWGDIFDFTKSAGPPA